MNPMVIENDQYIESLCLTRKSKLKMLTLIKNLHQVLIKFIIKFIITI